VDDFLTATDAELLKWMFFLWERMKLVVEPTGTLAAAALLERKLAVKGQRVGVVLSGGNVDVKSMAAMIRSP
jgi:threonine dehydratase